MSIHENKDPEYGQNILQGFSVNCGMTTTALKYLYFNLQLVKQGVQLFLQISQVCAVRSVQGPICEFKPMKKICGISIT